eukprot:TRINITY_DN38801_c0_g1_i1.p1 TRINITY_DN38801_c0_g1~~TRINITY_DN38801_c0_g1_i1.p1  ORF type:complete len:294 (+),score=38.82 TRINITY_DN38801_c0_g1_i1:352-1233(+)
MDGDSVGGCSVGSCAGHNVASDLRGEMIVTGGTEVSLGGSVTSQSLGRCSEWSDSFTDLDVSRLDLGHNDEEGSWTCAVCMDSIKLEDFAQVKGCDHTYCATCILRWAGTFKKDPWCPQCRVPFSMLYLYRKLDGSFNDYLMEEPVCLLLCASWFIPLTFYEEVEEPFPDYADEFIDEEEAEEMRYVRLSNRRWGENGFVRGGRMEARVSHNQTKGSGGGGKKNSGSAGNSSRCRLDGNGSNRYASEGGGGAAGGGSSGHGSANGEGSGGGKPAALGRRARRAKQRAAADVMC